MNPENSMNPKIRLPSRWIDLTRPPDRGVALGAPVPVQQEPESASTGVLEESASTGVLEESASTGVLEEPASTGVLEIIGEAACWTRLRESDRGVLRTGDRGVLRTGDRGVLRTGHQSVSAEMSFSVIGGGLLACVDDADDLDDAGLATVGQLVTLEVSGPITDGGRWVVRVTGTAQEPHPSVVGRTNYRRMDDLEARAGFVFVYIPADRIRGFCQI